MNQKQANRIVAAFMSGLLVSQEAFGNVGLPEADVDRLNKAADKLRDEMCRRAGRDDMRTATLEGLIADELTRET